MEVTNPEAAAPEVQFSAKARTKLDSLLSKLLRGPKGVGAEVAAPDPEQLRVVKTILKRCGPAALDFAYSQLHQSGFAAENSRARLMALYVLKEILDRSQYMRRAVFGGDIVAVVKQIVELQGMSSLPEPAGFAKVLHAKGLQYLAQWREAYGDRYPKLKVAAKFLDAYLPATADSALSLSIRQREERAREARAQRILRAQFDNISEAMMVGAEQGDEVLEIVANNDQMRQHLELLTPNVLSKLSRAHSSAGIGSSGGAVAKEAVAESLDHRDSEDEGFSDIEWDSDGQDDGSTGAGGSTSLSKEIFVDNGADELSRLNHIPNDYTLVLQVPVGPGTMKPLVNQRAEEKIAPSAEALIIESLSDCMKQAQRVHIPRLKAWVRILSQVELSEAHLRLKRGRLLKLALNLRNDLRALLLQSEDLGILRVVEHPQQDKNFDALFTGEVAPTSSRPPQPNPASLPKSTKKRRHKGSSSDATTSATSKKKPFNPFARRK